MKECNENRMFHVVQFFNAHLLAHLDFSHLRYWCFNVWKRNFSIRCVVDFHRHFNNPLVFTQEIGCFFPLISTNFHYDFPSIRDLHAFYRSIEKKVQKMIVVLLEDASTFVPHFNNWSLLCPNKTLSILHLRCFQMHFHFWKPFKNESAFESNDWKQIFWFT